jgi:hypothetical protein
MARRRTFHRPEGQRRYRRLFVIATEGAQTEPRYFAMFNSDQATIQVKVLRPGRKSDPYHVLEKLRRYLKDEGLRQSDEAWIVVDADQWPEERLRQLYQWRQEKAGHGLAVSNPKFEFWLLLHFEDGATVTGSQDCTRQLRRHLPNFGKSHLEVGKLKPLGWRSGVAGQAKRRAALRGLAPYFWLDDLSTG